MNTWSNDSCAVNLMSADLYNSLLIKSFASGEIDCHTSLLKLYDPWSTLLIISLFYLPPNGGFPQSMMNMITPMDHTSHYVV